MTDFLDEKRQEINKRLAELKPLVDEFKRLEAAVSALAGVGRSSSSRTAATATATPVRRGPGRPRGSGRAKKAAAAPAAKSAPKKSAAPKAGRRRAGRRKGSGTRSLEAFSFVQGQPGITIPELAAKMGIKQNYLYRVLPALQKEGKVAKRGRGWHPKGS